MAEHLIYLLGFLVLQFVTLGGYGPQPARDALLLESTGGFLMLVLVFWGVSG